MVVVSIPVETLSLFQTPDDNFEFIGWSGDFSGRDNPYLITLDRNISIRANFTDNYKTVGLIDYLVVLLQGPVYTDMVKRQQY